MRAAPLPDGLQGITIAQQGDDEAGQQEGQIIAAALAGARVDGAQVFAPFHFPNRRDYAVLFHGLVGDIFFLSRRRSLRISYCGLAFRHRNSEVLLFSLFCDWREGFCHSDKGNV